VATCECHVHVCITTSLVVSHVRIGFSHKKKKIASIKITDLRGSDYEVLYRHRCWTRHWHVNTDNDWENGI